MLEAFGFGFLAAGWLIVGGAIGIWARLPDHSVLNAASNDAAGGS